MLQNLAWMSLFVAAVCGVWIVVDEVRHPQSMAVMNVVWPVTALYGSLVALWRYMRLGRQKTADASRQDKTGGGKGERPASLEQAALGATHCAAGCMIADIGCAFAIAATGFKLGGSVLWAEFAVELVAAWTLGILFQYWAIKPMRTMSTGAALLAAMKADTLSIVAFQLGMYAWMAFVYFKLFTAPHLTPFSPIYWLMMQVAMVLGYATSLPMNWWLIRAGIKEAM